jgi:hypothetical protein
MHSVKIIASILALLVALAGIYLGFIALRQNAQLASGEQYSRSVAEMIVTNWSPDYFIANSSRQLLANLDARGIQLKLNGARRVGEFLSMGEARGELINPSWLPGGDSLVARYYIMAEFAAPLVSPRNFPSMHILVCQLQEHWHFLTRNCSNYKQYPIIL